MTFPEPDIDDILAEQAAERRIVQRLSCTDGMCGALDCFACRGQDAIDYIFAKEDEW